MFSCAGSCADLEDLVDLTDMMALSSLTSHPVTACPHSASSRSTSSQTSTSSNAAPAAAAASSSNNPPGQKQPRRQPDRPRSNWPYQLASMYVAAAAVAQLLPPVIQGTTKTVDRVQLAIKLLQEPAVDYNSGKAKKEAAKKLERRWNGLLEELAASLTDALALVSAACRYGMNLYPKFLWVRTDHRPKYN